MGIVWRNNMTNLKDYLNDMLMEYQKKLDNKEDPETARYAVLEEYMVLIIKRLMGY